MATPRLTPAMIAAGVLAGRKIIESYSKFASEQVNDEALFTIIETIGIAMVAAQESTDP